MEGMKQKNFLSSLFSVQILHINDNTRNFSVWLFLMD